ncbi:hypothetical protein Ancab_011707 [Ancistrocladus abbreviatus]
MILSHLFHYYHLYSYEDLKPPSSPSTYVRNGSPQDLKHYHSPYPVYDDLKPPTSPAPSAPNLSPISTASAALPQMVTRSDGSLHHAAESTRAETAGDKEHLAESKPRPLSPYTI